MRMSTTTPFSRFWVRKLGLTELSLEIAPNSDGSPSSRAARTSSLPSTVAIRLPGSNPACAGKPRDRPIQCAMPRSISERVTDRVKLRQPWMRMHGLQGDRCRIVKVTGESMEPTPPEGCSILVDMSRRKNPGRAGIFDSGGRPHRGQAGDHGPRGRVAHPERQPEQAGFADASVSVGGEHRRGGEVGRADIRVTSHANVFGEQLLMSFNSATLSPPVPPQEC